MLFTCVVPVDEQEHHEQPAEHVRVDGGHQHGAHIAQLAEGAARNIKEVCVTQTTAKGKDGKGW